MYKIEGADGKQYGPIALEQLQKWISEGRVNARTRVQAAGSSEWKTVAEMPELSALVQSGPVSPGTLPPAFPKGQAAGQDQGLAITSLVLGIFSVTCLFFLAGIPAVICGHLARNKVENEPGRYRGAGMALAGLIMGYISLALSMLLLPAAMLLPALSKAKERAQSINCMNNMKQIGLAYRTWALDHGDQYPANVSTNRGGTLELSVLGSDGFDENAYLQFQVMSNELYSPKILICVGDTSKQAALSFQNLQPGNVSYQARGTNANANVTNPQQVLAVCPIHGHTLLCDGSVQNFTRSRKLRSPK